MHFACGASIRPGSHGNDAAYHHSSKSIMYDLYELDNKRME
jgi:hypothetical protein